MVGRHHRDDCHLRSAGLLDSDIRREFGNDLTEGALAVDFRRRWPFLDDRWPGRWV